MKMMELIKMINRKQLYKSNERTLKELALNHGLKGNFEWTDTFGLAYLFNDSKITHFIVIQDLGYSINYIKNFEKEFLE